VSEISNVNNSLVQTTVDNLQLQEKIAYRVAAKMMDVARNQGAAVLSLLEGAADMVEIQGQQIDSSVTSAASSIGQNLDVHA
jgi:GTP cyclohydrolase I